LLLDEFGILEQLGIPALEFINFAKKAIYWREQAKFEFTKNLSRALDLVKTIGATFKIDREDLAFLDIRVLMSAYSSSFNLNKEMLKSIEKGKLDYSQAAVIELPSVLGNSSEILSFTEEDANPNFITSRSVAGIPDFQLENLLGKIVLIEGADPGYDWIFQKGLIGLITAYGGANSHMAVRCSELNLPAAIGVGDRLFKEIKSAFHVNLDCENRIIEYR
jgi:phosphohistidine swiveling domain-containing protein